MGDIDFPVQPFRWWDWREWRHRAAMRGFDDGTSWILHEGPCRNSDGGDYCQNRYYNRPFIFRKAYDVEFWEGASK
jgi:hypothetical protein